MCVLKIYLFIIHVCCIFKILPIFAIYPNFTSCAFLSDWTLKGETKRNLTKLAQLFLLSFSGYKHDRRLGHNLFEKWDPKLHLKYKNFLYDIREGSYEKKYLVSDLKNLINLKSLNRILPRFNHNFSSYEQFRRLGNVHSKVDILRNAWSSTQFLQSIWEPKYK